MYGESKQCTPCLEGGLQETLEGLDYQLNPDTEALGWSRLANAITVEETVIGQSADQGDEELNSEETRGSSMPTASRKRGAITLCLGCIRRPPPPTNGAAAFLIRISGHCSRRRRERI